MLCDHFKSASTSHTVAHSRVTPVNAGTSDHAGAACIGTLHRSYDNGHVSLKQESEDRIDRRPATLLGTDRFREAECNQSSRFLNMLISTKKNYARD